MKIFPVGVKGSVMLGVSMMTKKMQAREHPLAWPWEDGGSLERWQRGMGQTARDWADTGGEGG